LRLLLDTHVFVWLSSEPERLGERARAVLADPTGEVFVSVVSAWEIAIKVAAGRLAFPVAIYAAEVAAAGFVELAIHTRHALAAGALPRHHGDPFDRMLLAQARLEGLTLVTADRALAAYGVPILPADA
jgi:PIN domain nuclease of toxin-antitoxin system